MVRLMVRFLTLMESIVAQAQCILFKRCSDDLAPFKYAGYPMLLQAVALPSQDAPDGQPQAAHFLSEEIAPRLMVRAQPYFLSLRCLPPVQEVLIPISCTSLVVLDSSEVRP